MKIFIGYVIGGLLGCFLGWAIAFAICKEDRFGFVRGTFNDNLRKIEELLSH
jgi:hypothetical protein